MKCADSALALVLKNLALIVEVSLVFVSNRPVVSAEPLPVYVNLLNAQSATTHLVYAISQKKLRLNLVMVKPGKLNISRQ